MAKPVSIRCRFLGFDEIINFHRLTTLGAVVGYVVKAAGGNMEDMFDAVYEEQSLPHEMPVAVLNGTTIDIVAVGDCV